MNHFVTLLVVMLTAILVPSSAFFMSLADQKPVSYYPRSRLSVFRPSRWSGEVSCSDFPSSSLFTNSRFIKDVFNDIESSLESAAGGGRRLPLDVKEDKSAYEIIADVPGVKKEDIKITIKDHVLSISYTRNQIEKKEGESIRREERYSGATQRSLTLPENADQANVKARYENGVLFLTVPKLPEEPKDEPRTVAIE